MSRMFTFLFIVAVLFVLLIGGVSAQDAVEVTPEVIQALTDTGTDIIVIPPVDTGGGSDGFTVWELIAVIGAVFTTATFSLVGLMLVSEKLRNNPSQMTTLERAFNSIPQEAMQKIYELSQVVADVGRLVVSVTETLKEATDGVPIKDKPAQASFKLIDSGGNEQIVYYQTGTALLGQVGRFQQHEDGTLTWQPDVVSGERG